MAKEKFPAGALEFFREQGRKGGKLSSAARMVKLTPEQRSAIAKNAVAAREAKRAETATPKSKKATPSKVRRVKAKKEAAKE